MQERLVKFQGHIRTERYALNGTTETALRKRYERYINPHYIVGIEQHTDPSFESQQMFYVSAKEYCQIYTSNGGRWDVDGTLEQVAEQVYNGNRTYELKKQ